MKLFVTLFHLVYTLSLKAGATDLHITTSRKDIKTVSIKIGLRDADIKQRQLKKTALLEPGKFFISLNENEPQYVSLIMDDSLVSEAFFLDYEAQRLDVIIDQELKLKIKNSIVQDEYTMTYNPTLEEINREINDFFTGAYRDAYIKYNGRFPDSVQNKVDSIRTELREKRFSTIKDYIISHPDSYVAMWKLLEEIEIYGYKKKLAESYSSFSEKLRASTIGKIVKDKLALALSIEPGHSFPDFPVRDMNLKPVQLKAALQGKYILVDFWYNNCYPCIEQFPAFKELYNLYTRNQFMIVSISVDKMQDINKWKQTIAKYSLPFLQYLDENGQISYSKLSIVKFPTNFLLDSNGKIVAKDIAPEKLKTFLMKEL
jgi:peroxiredoxin